MTPRGAVSCTATYAPLRTPARRTWGGISLRTGHSLAGERDQGRAVGALQGGREGAGRLLGIGRADDLHVRDQPERGDGLDGLVGRAVLPDADRVVRVDVDHRQPGERGEPHRRPGIVGEDEEGRDRGPEEAVVGDPVRDRGHPVLADAEADVAPGPVRRVEILVGRDVVVASSRRGPRSRRSAAGARRRGAGGLRGPPRACRRASRPAQRAGSSSGGGRRSASVGAESRRAAFVRIRLPPRLVGLVPAVVGPDEPAPVPRKIGAHVLAHVEMLVGGKPEPRAGGVGELGAALPVRPSACPAPRESPCR